MKPTPRTLLAFITAASSLGIASAQDCYGSSRYRDPDPYCMTERLTREPYVERTEAVPTAYSSMMKHYYDSVWASPTPPPQVIVIHDRY